MKFKCNFTIAEMTIFEDTTVPPQICWNLESWPFFLYIAACHGTRVIFVVAPPTTYAEPALISPQIEVHRVGVGFHRPLGWHVNVCCGPVFS